MSPIAAVEKDMLAQIYLCTSSAREDLGTQAPAQIFRDDKHSLPRKIPLRHATGMSHLHVFLGEDKGLPNQFKKPTFWQAF